MATLKISYLSVGDWVKFRGNIGAIWSIYQATMQSPDEVALLSGNTFLGVVPVSELQPIPITAEILERNGWSSDGMYARLRIDEHLHLEYYYHEHRLRKYYCIVDEWQNHAKVNDITFQAHCYSVHQLQRALRLAGGR